MSGHAVGHAGDNTAPRKPLLRAGTAAPDWELSEPGGRKHSLSQYRGKIVVLDFWATWCGPCLKVMPGMEKLRRQYGEKGVVVFGVNSFETGDPVAHMKEKAYTYPTLINGDDVAGAYGVAILPAVCIIGGDGKIIYCRAGADHKNLASLVEKHLKKLQGT
jgi:thiol-disulfide isomerase/thioredoxin